MTGWCPYKDGDLKDVECHFDGYCEECPWMFEYLIKRSGLISEKWGRSYRELERKAEEEIEMFKGLILDALSGGKEEGSEDD